jgi:L-2-hydroxyglutarate oxidase LhgO
MAAAAAALPSSTSALQQQLATNLEFQPTGSLLLATTDDEVQQLQERASMLQRQDIQGMLYLYY